MSQITKIEMQKNKKGRVNIFLDETFFCGMQEIVAVKHGLKVGQEIEETKLLRLVTESDKEQALNKVAHYLQYGLRTKEQLLTYLKQKGYEENVISFVIEKLETYNFVNDEYYAKQYVSQNAKRYGKRKLEFMLKQKGISKQDVANTLSDYETSPDVILGLAKKYLKGRPITLELRGKLAQHLAYKGFEWEEINKAISNLEK